jgi:hypothetical protein
VGFPNPGLRPARLRIAGSQSGVQSVTGASVDNTDPFNPVVNAAALTAVAPQSVAAANAVGVGTAAAREDHTHLGVQTVTAADGSVTVAGALPARTIAVVYGGAPPSIAAASSAGVAVTAARSDHTHLGIQTVTAADGSVTVAGALPARTIAVAYGAAPPNVTPAGSATGAAVTAARSDHTHGGPVATQQASGAIGPLATVTFTTTNILATRSGLVYVTGVLSAQASGVSTQTMTMGIDGVTKCTGRTGTGGAGPFSWTGTFVFQATVANHTYFITAAASAGTDTVAAGEAQISVLEL